MVAALGAAAESSLLVALLRLVDRIPLPPPPPRARGRPAVYPERVFLKALVIMVVRRLPRVGTLLAVLEEPTPEMRRLRALLHRSPRPFGRGTSLWTLDLAAAVAHEQGLTATRVSGETIRATLARRGVGWKRAKRWLVSPDPAYRRKKGPATA
jgi:hypothetical protein